MSVQTASKSKNGEYDSPAIEGDVAKALQGIAYQLKWLGNGDAIAQMGAIEGHSVMVKEAGEAIAGGLHEVARAIEKLAEAVETKGGAK